MDLELMIDNMKGLNYLVLIFIGFVLLANVFWIIQGIYYLCIGRATINKNAFKIPTKKIKQWWKTL